MRRLLALLVPLLAWPAATAHGATVSYSSVNILDFTAAAGEANRLTITATETSVVFAEAGGVVLTEAEADCTGTGTSTVTCLRLRTSATVRAVNTQLGDLDDEAKAGGVAPPGFSIGFHGGPGADELDLSATHDGVLDGGPGGDDLTGASQESSFFDGSGADVMTGGPAGSSNFYAMSSLPDEADVIRGGAGYDAVRYERELGVRVSADGVADDGLPGEGDQIPATVEALSGGEGDDLLVASASRDSVLIGWDGDDRLVGGAGDDRFQVEAGDDRYEGGAGDDTVAYTGEGFEQLEADNGADSFTGGAGRDRFDYGNGLLGVTVRLDDLANDGTAGEGDNVHADVEEIATGRGADVLVGGPAAERFTTRDGNDAVTPGGGADEVSTGAGADTIRAADGAADVITCGLGVDTASGDFSDTVTGCENAVLSPPPLPPDVLDPVVTLSGVKARPRFKAVRRGLRVRLDADEPAAYRVELLATARSARIARKWNLVLVRRTVGITGDAVAVRLKPKRALLGAPRKVRLRLRVTAIDAAANTSTVARTLRVRR